MKEFQKNCGEDYNFISSIFHFWLVNDGWFSQILCVKEESQLGDRLVKYNAFLSQFSFRL